MFMIAFFIFILGLVLGSFINAFLYRYQERKTLMGRSFCPICKHQIAWYDNIPLISWLMLSAKCRYCKKAISVQYPVVELLAGIIALVVAQKSGLISMLNDSLFNFKNFQLSSLLAFFMLSSLFLVLLTIAIHDIKNREIPNGFNLTFVILAFGYLLFSNVGSQYNLQNTINYLLSAVVAFAFFYSFAFFSKETWMGGGDAKLAFGIGLLLGPSGTFLSILVASWLGSIYGLTMIVFNRNLLSDKSTQTKLETRKSHEIPFGPFLALATLISYIYASQIIGWYVRIFLGI